MTNEQYAKNGQLVSAVKNFEEMTGEEKEAIRPVDKGQFVSYHVQYNKNGELLHVSGAELKEEVNADVKPDLLDSLQVLFNKNKHSKAYQSAKKRLDVTNEQINEARQVINRG
ncbi:hypothetical protein LMB49_03875 [Limosilactobacillus reuteri]|uniref:hypothetical protein n=1 Tax=Limosilactobacillus reuteri TaxID=1598 RepID=UPI001E5C6C05|nr:hypothetical protein [Limosilactobacillus reuteri]MCC4370536.1 hypothetical protein [Limosilactobacillus reuteri]MCC4509409.1 hypothetical protein [Limosilactobacillus reuteri]